MWDLTQINSQAVREAVQKSRSYTVYRMYRTRTPLTLSQIQYAMSFLYTHETSDITTPCKVFFKTVATPRDVELNDGVDTLAATTIDEHVDNIPYNFFVINTINNKEVGEAFVEYLTARGAERLTEYRTTLTQSPYHRTELLYSIDGEHIKYYLFTNKMNDEIVNRLAGCVCKHLNHMFGEYNEQIAAALLNANQQEYERLVQAHYDATFADRQREQLLEAISLAATQGFERQKQALEQELRNKQNAINRYLDNLSAVYDEQRELQIRFAGLLTNGANDEELKEFLMHNIDNITFAKVSEDNLYLRYRTPLMYWDEDIYKILRESSNRNAVTEQSAARKQLLDDIFINRTVTLWLDSGVEYSLTHVHHKHVNVNRYFDNTPSLKGLPNPHHYYFDCWGDNAASIREAQARGDNVFALAQVFAAIAGINIADNVVFNKFVNTMLCDFEETPCLEIKETKEMLTISQYLQRH